VGDPAKVMAVLEAAADVGCSKQAALRAPERALRARGDAAVDRSGKGAAVDGVGKGVAVGELGEGAEWRHVLAGA
jgi:hypothetical protein